MSQVKTKKHNKKRNTAFLYESLMRELTKTVLQADAEKKEKIISICKEHFSKNSSLYKEKMLYDIILECRELKKDVAEKILVEVKKERDLIDEQSLFNEQTSLINKINKELDGKPFTNFVPDYKNLATIFQVFSKSTPIKERILLENVLLENMCLESDKKEEAKLQSIDNLTYKTFVNKFNEKYSANLSEQQRKLVTQYIMSFMDNGVEFKYFVNEEIGRLKEEIEKAANENDIFKDDVMKDNVKKVYNMLSETRKSPINESTVLMILKTQEMIKELGENN